MDQFCGEDGRVGELVSLQSSSSRRRYEERIIVYEEGRRSLPAKYGCQGAETGRFFLIGASLRREEKHSSENF